MDNMSADYNQYSYQSAVNLSGNVFKNITSQLSVNLNGQQNLVHHQPDQMRNGHHAVNTTCK